MELVVLGAWNGIELYQRQPNETRNLHRQFSLVFLRFLTQKTFIIVMASVSTLYVKSCLTSFIWHWCLPLDSFCFFPLFFREKDTLEKPVCILQIFIMLCCYNCGVDISLITLLVYSRSTNVEVYFLKPHPWIWSWITVMYIVSGFKLCVKIFKIFTLKNTIAE